MEKRSKPWMPTGWGLGLAILVAGATVAVVVAPTEASADCDAGHTCALFVNDDGVEFDVCAIGFEPDQILALEVFEPGTYNAVQSFGWVE